MSTSLRLESEVLDPSSELTYFLIRTLPEKSSPLRLKLRYQRIRIPDSAETVAEAIQMKPKIPAGFRLINDPVAGQSPLLAAHALFSVHEYENSHGFATRVSLDLNNWHMVWVAKRKPKQSAFVHQLTFVSKNCFRMMRVPQSEAMQNYFDDAVKSSRLGSLKSGQQDLDFFVHMQCATKQDSPRNTMTLTNLDAFTRNNLVALLVLGLTTSSTVNIGNVSAWITKVLSEQNKLHQALEQTKTGNLPEVQQIDQILETLKELRAWSLFNHKYLADLVRNLVLEDKMYPKFRITGQNEKFWQFYEGFLELCLKRTSSLTIRDAAYLRDKYLDHFSMLDIKGIIREFCSGLKPVEDQPPFISKVISCRFGELEERVIPESSEPPVLANSLHSRIESLAVQLRANMAQTVKPRLKTAVNTYCFTTFGANTAINHVQSDLSIFGCKPGTFAILEVFQTGPDLCLLVKGRTNEFQGYRLIRSQQDKVLNTVAIQGNLDFRLRELNGIHIIGSNLILISKNQGDQSLLATILDCKKLFESDKQTAELMPADLLLCLPWFDEYSYTSDYFVHATPSLIGFSLMTRGADGTCKRDTRNCVPVEIDRLKVGEMAGPVTTKMACSSIPNQFVLVSFTDLTVERLMYYRIDPTDLQPTLIGSSYPGLTFPSGGNGLRDLTAFHHQKHFYVSVHNGVRQATFTLHRRKVHLVRINSLRFSWINTRIGSSLASVMQPPGYYSGVHLKSCPQTGATSIARLMYTT